MRYGVPVTLLACALQAQAAPATEIGAAEFGIFDASVPGELAFEATRTIPRQAGVRYGWVIDVKTTQRRVSVREEYLLPSRAANTALTEGTQRAELPRQVQVSQRELVPMGGRIYGEWSVGPNEPAGPRVLQVVVDNMPAARFEFDIQ